MGLGRDLLGENGESVRILGICSSAKTLEWFLTSVFAWV